MGRGRIDWAVERQSRVRDSSLQERCSSRRDLHIAVASLDCYHMNIDPNHPTPCRGAFCAHAPSRKPEGIGATAQAQRDVAWPPEGCANFVRVSARNPSKTVPKNLRSDTRMLTNADISIRGRELWSRLLGFESLRPSHYQSLSPNSNFHPIDQRA